MNKILAFLVLLFFVDLSVCEELSCDGRATGFYCVDKTRYAWCYGNPVPAIYTCTASLECPCGFTTSSPCSWPGTKPSPCSGNPGDITGAVTSSSSVEEEDSSDSTEVPVAEPPEVPVPSKRMASAYFTNWPQYHYGSIDGYNCRFVPSNIDASHLTHIFYAFAIFDETFKVKNFEWNDFDFYQEVQAKKKTYPHLKTLISIGGWNFNLFDSTKHLFSLMASKQSYRKIFIDSVITYAHTHGFDGIDIDWEYPGFEDQGGKPRDTENFTKLLRELRVAINKDTRSPKLLLSIAAPGGEGKIALIQANKIHKYLDWINLMAYDYHGSWDNEVGPHTALKEAFSTINTEHATELYLKAGVPAQKMILGLAAYGRTWNLVQPGVSATYGTAANGAGRSGICTQENGFLSSFEIAYMIKQGATAVAHKPTDTWFAYNNDQFVTYDTVDTHTEKIKFACSNNFGGAFMWAMDLDTNYQMINNMYNQVYSKTCDDLSSSVIPPVESSSSSSLPLPPIESSSSSSSIPVPIPSDCKANCLTAFQKCVEAITKMESVCPCFVSWGNCLSKC